MSQADQSNSTQAETGVGTDPILEQIYGEVDMTPEVSPADLHAKIADLEAQLKDTQARANAEIYNFQKRVERETDNVKKFALEKFATSMLDVVDNLERAMATPATDANQAMIDGVSLTHKGMITALEKHGVTVINPVDAVFNAEFHQAVGIDPTAVSGQVGKVLQKGYALSGRLLRPAMVMVGE